MRQRDLELHSIPHLNASVTTILALLLSWAMGPSIGMTAPSSQSDSISDKHIALALENTLAKQDPIPSDNLDIDVQQGIVKLKGLVNNMLAREKAIEMAETIKGVRSVVNNIIVEPLEKPTDTQLNTEILTALTGNPATESFEIDVHVHDGVVTLTGTVDSWQEKQLAAQVVKGVKGVTELRNDLTWEPVPMRPDEEIFHEITKRLQGDPWVSGNPVTVKVTNRAVTLSGKVGSIVEQRRAKNLAWVTGVSSVDASNLEIDWEASDQTQRSPSDGPPSDTTIKEAIEDSFAYDPRVHPFDSTIIVENGSVTLLGIVNNLQSKKAAEEDARNTIGVWHVRNLLKVRPRQSITDAEIKSNVSAGFLRDPFVERHELEVQVRNGHVYLTGSVDFPFERNQAESIASSVKGVVDVLNHITVNTFWTWRPDHEIREDIASELWWSPFVDRDQVTVKIENGVATLSGQVDTWLERAIASENAYEGGAKRVINRLTVKHFKHS